MSLSLNRVVNVQLNGSSPAIQALDFTLSLFVTDIASDQFVDGLYLYVSEQSEVENIFGTNTEIAKATSKAFSHPLRPKQILIGYWNKTGVPVIARANSLTATASPLPFANLSSTYNFTINSRNVSEVVSYAADETVTDYDTFITALNNALGDSSRFIFSYANNVISLSSKVVGADVDTDNISIEVATYEPNNIATDLRLTTARGVKQVRGVNGSTPAAQSIVEFISAVDNKQPNYFGFYSTVTLSDSEIELAQERLSSAIRKHLFAVTALADYTLDFDNTNPFYRIAAKNTEDTIVQLNKLNDKHAVVELLVQATSTNWDAVNTAQTNKFKTQSSVQSDAGIDTTAANKAERLGINYYTDYSGTSFLAEGRTLGTEVFFIDSYVSRCALENRIQIGAVNRLKSSPKIPQTDAGQATLIGALVPILEQFVNNGFIGQGLTWNSNGFGTLSTGDVIERGYYMYSDSYVTQTQSDREARKAMPIQIAVKEAGAIHSVDILIYVER